MGIAGFAAFPSMSSAKAPAQLPGGPCSRTGSRLGGEGQQAARCVRQGDAWTPERREPDWLGLPAGPGTRDEDSVGGGLCPPVGCTCEREGQRAQVPSRLRGGRVRASGRWVVARRREFARAGSLDPERGTATWLRFTGMGLEHVRDRPGTRASPHLSEYVQREGSARVPRRTRGGRVLRWAPGSRGSAATFAKGTLAAQRAARLTGPCPDGLGTQKRTRGRSA